MRPDLAVDREDFADVARGQLLEAF